MSSGLGDLITFAAQKTVDLSADRLFWATVTQTSPLRVREDTASENINITPKTLAHVMTGNRVLCLRYGRRLVILGKMGGQEPPEPIKQPTPTLLQLINGVTHYGRGYTSARYFKTAEGIVYLEGFVENVTGGVTIANLPPGFRPGNRNIHLTSGTSGVFARVDVMATGDVIIGADPTPSRAVSLSGISFLAN